MESSIKNISDKFKSLKIKDKNINFKHSDSGIVKSGVYKGSIVEIREYIPEKIEVLMDNKIVLSTRKNLRGKTYTIKNIKPAVIIAMLPNYQNITLKADDVFYRDILIKRRNIEYYVNVRKITQKGNDKNYYINGEIFENGNYINIEFRKSDIIEYIDPFKITTDQQEPTYLDRDKSESDSESDIFGDESESESDIFGYETGSESGSESGSDSGSETRSEIGDRLDSIDYRPSVSYNERTNVMQNKELKKDDYSILKYIEHILLSIKNNGVINSKMFSKQADRLDEINRKNMLPNVLNVLDEINKITEYMNTILKDINKSITVGSIDHKFIISGIVFLYVNNENNFEKFINDLIKSKYISKSDLKECIVLKNGEKFDCKINKEKDIDKLIKNIQSCFIKIIESKLKLKGKVKSTSINSEVEFIEPKSRKRIRNESESDSESEPGPGSEPGPEFSNSIKDQLINKRKITKDKNKIILYDYLIENFDNINEKMDELVQLVVPILTGVHSNFKVNYEICKDIPCKRKTILNYIEKTFIKISNREKIGITQNDNLNLQKYKELNKIRIIKNRETLSPPKEYNNKRLKRFIEKLKKKGKK
jgi:hypothetical protein